jgi:putative tributyrin esterase
VDEMKFPHVYRECPGVHDWAYWDLHVQEAIAFHRESLAMERGARRR